MAIPFLDTLVTPEADHSLSITVYCNPTHTDQYLQWDSNHNLFAMYSVIGTLTISTKTTWTTPELLNEELEHLREVLENCKYPRWTINKIQQKLINNNQEGNGNSNNLQEETTQCTDSNTCTEANNNNNNNNNKPSTGQIVVLYVQGLRKALRRSAAGMGYTHTSRAVTPSSKG